MNMITIFRSAEFDKWLARLRDKKAVEKIFVRLARMEDGNFGDVRPVGEGVSEARIHYGAGYRLYFIRRGSDVVVMLGGGDKSSQVRDIEKVKLLAKQWRAA